MKHGIIRRIFAAGCVLALGVAASPAIADDAGATLVPVITSNEFVLSGEVVSRSDVGFTLLGTGAQLTTVLVNPDTTITKGAVTIRLSDVMVGDKISVTVMRVADGSLQAVSVLVRTGYGG